MENTSINERTHELVNAITAYLFGGGLFNPELIMPGKNGKLFTCKGATVKRDIFEKVMDDYYSARGWDVKTGLFTKVGLKNLDLADMIPKLEEKDFLI